MMSLEIAGKTLTYRNAPELNKKIRTLREELQSERAVLENQCKALRQKERSLERFLGEGPAPNTDAKSGPLPEASGHAGL